MAPKMLAFPLRFSYNHPIGQVPTGPLGPYSARKGNPMPKNRNRNSPVKTVVPPVTAAPAVDLSKMSNSELANWYASKAREDNKQASTAELGVMVGEFVTELVTKITERYPGKTVRALTIQIKDGEFLKFGRVSIVKPRGEGSTESAESEAA